MSLDSYQYVKSTQRFYRIMFRLAWFLFCFWTPRLFNPVRLMVLRLFGAKVGKGVVVYGSASIWAPKNLVLGDGSCLGPRVKVYNVTATCIGARTVISQDSQLCTPSHQFNLQSFDLISSDIFVGSDCWVAANCFIGPGTVLEDGVILGASSVVSGRMCQVGVYVGNPARKVRDRRCIQFLF